MWTPIKHPLFVTATFLFLCNQLLEYLGLFLPFLHSYLDDLLVMPIFLSLGLSAMRLIYKNPHGRLNSTHLLLATLWVSFLFEYWFPSYKANHFADAWDVVAYFCGSFLFYYVGVANDWVYPLKRSKN